MGEDAVVRLPRPGGVVEDDPLLREGARLMLMQAIQAEVDVFVEGQADLVGDQGRHHPHIVAARPSAIFSRW